MANYIPEYYHATRKGEQPLTLPQTQAILEATERSRGWCEAKPEEIAFTDEGTMMVGGTRVDLCITGKVVA